MVKNFIMGSTLGRLFRIVTFGESYSKGVGVVIEGIPSRLKVVEKDLQKEVDSRKPKNFWDNGRKESDKVEILSGVFNNKTLGTPIAVIVRNHSGDASKYSPNTYRPGHGDITYNLKYGIRDFRGGGRSSARETVARVIAGYFAGLIIPKVKIDCSINEIGGISYEKNIKRVQNLLKECKLNGESLSSTISVTIKGVSAGLGEPVMDKLRSELAKALFSIGGCVSVSFGEYDTFLKSKGSDLIKKRSNFAGIEGGISNGEDIKLNLLFRAPSTTGKMAKFGNHDVCIGFRAISVIKAMIKIVIADYSLIQKGLHY